MLQACWVALLFTDTDLVARNNRTNQRSFIKNNKTREQKTQKRMYNREITEEGQVWNQGHGIILKSNREQIENK